MRNPDAKPCPHCGGTRIRFDVHPGAGRGMHHNGQDVWSMCCYVCGATFPNMYSQEGLLEKWNRRVEPALAHSEAPIPMLLHCPTCGTQHIDAPVWETICDSSIGLQIKEVCRWHNPPHRSHLCGNCGTIWRPADVCTTGVARIETKGKADTWSPE